MKSKRKRNRVFRTIVFLFVLGWSIPPSISQDKKLPSPAEKTPPQTIIVVQGAGGSDEYQKAFSDACQKIQVAARKSKADFFWIGNPDSKKKVKPEVSDKQLLQQTLAGQLKGVSQLWLILIGHGTYDRKLAKFNLRGPDVTAKEMNDWLGVVERPVAIINCASASSPFINRLAAKNRVIVTATKSGFELNYARFGIHFANALTDMSADIDKDEQVSLLESFLFASRKVEEFYKAEGRLATEHAIIDDNGDGKGTPLGFFRGIRVVKASGTDAVPDGPIANQIHLIRSEFEKLLTIENRKMRNELESQLEKLRLKKSEMNEDEYFDELEVIALQLSKLYQQIEAENQKPDKPDSDNPDSTDSEKEPGNSKRADDAKLIAS